MCHHPATAQCATDLTVGRSWISEWIILSLHGGREHAFRRGPTHYGGDNAGVVYDSVGDGKPERPRRRARPVPHCRCRCRVRVRRWPARASWDSPTPTGDPQCRGSTTRAPRSITRSKEVDHRSSSDTPLPIAASIGTSISRTVSAESDGALTSTFLPLVRSLSR